MNLRSFLVVALLVLAACGGGEAAPPKAASPPAREEATPEPRTIEEAQDQIARLSAELGLAANANAKSDTRPAPPPPAPDATSQTRPASEPRASTDSAGGAASYDACASPCRALASMRRAVDALCRMTGETDDRCVGAKKTLADSVGRTASCKCST